MSNRMPNHLRSQGKRLAALACCALTAPACSDEPQAGIPAAHAAGSAAATAPPDAPHVTPPTAAAAGTPAVVTTVRGAAAGSVATARNEADAASGTGAAGNASTPSAAGAASPVVFTADTCAGTRSFTRALRVEIHVDWPATIGLDAGSGTVVIYAKLSYRKSVDQWLTEARPCGADLPVITTSLLVNNLKSVNRIPSAAFDRALIPVVQGVVARSGGMLTIAGGGLFGAELPDPDAVWPSADALKAVDHDGDGKPGVTAFPQAGESYIVPPLSVAQDRTADQVYVAARARYTLHAPQKRCEDVSGGMATIDAFDYSIIGCHALDGVECAPEETRFLARAAPVFTVASTGAWMQREVPDDATCSQVQAAFAP